MEDRRRLLSGWIDSTTGYELSMWSWKQATRDGRNGPGEPALAEVFGSISDPRIAIRIGTPRPTITPSERAGTVGARS